MACVRLRLRRQGRKGIRCDRAIFSLVCAVPSSNACARTSKRKNQHLNNYMYNKLTSFKKNSREQKKFCPAAATPGDLESASFYFKSSAAVQKTIAGIFP
jgi:hypothetical protein